MSLGEVRVPLPRRDPRPDPSPVPTAAVLTAASEKLDAKLESLAVAPKDSPPPGPRKTISAEVFFFKVFFQSFFFLQEKNVYLFVL